MGNKMGVLAGGMFLGMVILVACEPLYQNLTEVKDQAMKKISKAKTKAENSLTNVKQKVILKSETAVDAIQDRIDDLINMVESIDLDKFKGKTKMTLETLKQKVMTLKQN